MVTIEGDSRNNTLRSLSSKTSYLYGYAGDDRLYGEQGIDHLYGGTGNDLLYGGTGNDWLYGEGGTDKYFGGDGFDGVSFFRSTSVAFALDNSFAPKGAAVGDVFSSIEDLDGSDTGADRLAGNSGDNRIWGNGGDDRLFGRAGADSLEGGAGRDLLDGSDGDDWLVGGKDGDQLIGGLGVDGASYNASNGVTVSLDYSLDAKGEALGDTFSSIEKLEGSFLGADRLSGDEKHNNLYGLGGNDLLYGRGGDDWLQGGKGADTLFGGLGYDGASYYQSSGVTISLDGSLTAMGDAVGDVFNSIEKLEGSFTGSDRLSGNDRDNVLFGLGGNDTLYGRNGDDWLQGGKGADTHFGGLGNDGATYNQSSGVTVSLDGSLTAKGDAVGDTFSSIEMLEGSSTGNDKLSGNTLDNTIWGLGGNDTLYGRDGNDWLQGGAGADIMYGGLGRDGASYYQSSGVTVSLDGSLIAKGDAVGDIFMSIEKLEGSFTGNDRLSGNALDNNIFGLGGNDTLYGRDGNDWLLGGAGADIMYGGLGSDGASYYSSSGVTVSLDGSFGASGDALGDILISIEKLEGSNEDRDFLIGDHLANSIFGLGGNDELWGRAGDDRLFGEDGADVIIGGAGDDLVVGLNGSDTLYGGEGDDNFGFAVLDGFADFISDFSIGDQIHLDSSAFPELQIGVLPEANFVLASNIGAMDETPHFIYNIDTLSYDEDGSGTAHVAKDVAVFQNGYVLSHTEIEIVIT